MADLGLVDVSSSNHRGSLAAALPLLNPRVAVLGNGGCGYVNLVVDNIVRCNRIVVRIPLVTLAGSAHSAIECRLAELGQLAVRLQIARRATAQVRRGFESGRRFESRGFTAKAQLHDTGVQEHPVDILNGKFQFSPTRN